MYGPYHMEIVVLHVYYVPKMTFKGDDHWLTLILEFQLPRYFIVRYVTAHSCRTAIKTLKNSANFQI